MLTLGVRIFPVSQARAHARRWEVIVVGALLLLAVFVNFYRLGTPSAHTDELTYSRAGVAYVDGNLAPNREHPPLVKYLIGASETIFGHSLTAARIPSALAGIATGVVLLVFGMRLAGRVTGIVALALWVLIPHAVRAPNGSLEWSKIERLALLEPLTAFFMVSALLFAYIAYRSTTLRYAAFAGVALGLAASSKLIGVLVAPAILVGAAVFVRDPRRAMRQSLTIVGVAALTFAFAYLPFGRAAPAAIHYMFRFQGEHSRIGHAVIVAGHRYVHPPWWSQVWWEWQAFGPAVTVAFLAAIVAGLVAAGWRVAFFLGTAVAVPFLFLAFGVGFSLAHYGYVWYPITTLLAAVGLTATGRALQRKSLPRAGFVGLLWASVVLTFLITAAQLVFSTTRLQPNGYAAAAQEIARRGSDTGVVLVWGERYVMSFYLPHSTVVVGTEAVDPQAITAVVVDEDYSKRLPNIHITHFVTVNRTVLEKHHFGWVDFYSRHSG